MSGPSAPNDIRLVTSTTTLPATASPISRGDLRRAGERDGEDDDVAAAAAAAAFERRDAWRRSAAADGRGILGVARRDRDVVAGADERRWRGRGRRCRLR